MVKTNHLELNPYIKERWSLIPLHSYDTTDIWKGKKRLRGKSPRDANWTKRVYKSKDQIEYMKGGGNVGVRLRTGDLVIDVDPRNYENGIDSFERFKDDFRTHFLHCPAVETGSGGLHIYMKKPDNVAVKDSLPEYPGIEFKTFGRQVVAAGSIHPDTHRLYEWDWTRPDLSKIVDAPATLIARIARPKSIGSLVGGQYDQNELAKMLDELNPQDFREHDRWLKLMQACHHATGGDGRHEFIEWCTRDPHYADHGGQVGRRWDSLHADSTGPRVTYRTLIKFLEDAGRGDAVPRIAAKDDFEIVGNDTLPIIDTEEQIGPLERMNEKYIAAVEGSRFRIFWQNEIDDGNIRQKRWVRMSAADFKQMLSHQWIQRFGSSKRVQVAEEWLEWPQRRTVDQIIFDPAGGRDRCLNLWTGWGVEPRKGGSWALLDELLFEVLCNGSDNIYNYVMNWAAYMVQHPASPAEVALCFKGGQGVGKGTFARALVRIAGQHGMQITSSDQLTGRFNSHLREIVLLFADEALRPYDKVGESRLKSLLTEKYIAYEGKGQDVVSGRNMLHVIMASNEDWFVPVSLDGNRRFFVQEANAKWAGQHSKFQKLNDQLNKGGLATLMWELMHRDIENWAPRGKIPFTTAAIDQALMNSDPVEQWWLNNLYDGTPSFPIIKYNDQDDWEGWSVGVFIDDLKESFSKHCAKNGIRYAGSMGRGIDTLFMRRFRKLVPGCSDRHKFKVPSDRYDLKVDVRGYAWGVIIPKLHVCRDSINMKSGGKINWDKEY